MGTFQNIWTHLLLGIILAVMFAINNNIKEIIKQNAAISCVMVSSDVNSNDMSEDELE